jgi:hypothetical protein
MDALLPAVDEWFATKGEHLAAFAAADCRLEGWFKGELLVLFRRLREQGVIDDFQRELNVPLETPSTRFQIDFKLQIDGDEHLCELKALCISQAAGTPRNLKFYFRDDHVGLIRDMQKLAKLPARNKWLMAFVYPTPSIDLWTEVVASVPAALAHCRPINAPTKPTAPLFVSLWRFDAAG